MIGIRLLLGGLALGLVHVVAVGSGGLYAHAGVKLVALSALSHAGWVAALVVLTGLVVELVLRRSSARGAWWLAAALYGLAWTPFLLRQTRLSSLVSQSSVTLALVLFLVVGALALAARSLLGASREHPRPRRWALPLVLALAMAVVPPLLRPSATGALPSGDLDRDRTEELRPAAARHFSSTRWNVLLLTVDTLRADHLGMYGYEKNTSPVFDALAARGLRFTNAMTIRPKTSPAVASLLTGVYPVRHGIHAPATILDERQRTLAERLRELGYGTGASITNGNLFPTFQFDQGFEHYAFGSHDASEVSDLAIAWLDSVGTADAPWHLWAHYTDPHTPYDPPGPYREMFREADATKRSQELIALYDGEIRYTDTEIARVLEWLDLHPDVRERTLIVVTADHGESLGEHDYWFEHGLHPYEPSAHIPLLFVAPGFIEADSVSDELASIVDVVPTILDAVGAPDDSIVQGRSLLPLLAGLTDESPRDFAFVEAGYGEHIGPGRTRALRRRSSKYVERLVEWARWPRHPVDLVWILDARTEGALAGDEFYDLLHDPGETENLRGGRGEDSEAERIQLMDATRLFGSSSFDGPELDPENMDAESLRSLRALGYVD